MNFNSSYAKLEKLVNTAYDPLKWSVQKPMKWQIVQAALETAKLANSSKEIAKLRELEGKIHHLASDTHQFFLGRTIRKILSIGLNLGRNKKFASSQFLLKSMPITWRIKKIFAGKDETQLKNIEKALLAGKEIEALSCAEKAPTEIKELVQKALQEHFSKLPSISQTMFSAVLTSHIPNTKELHRSSSLLKAFFKQPSSLSAKYKEAREQIQGYYPMGSFSPPPIIVGKISSLAANKSLVLQGKEKELYKITKKEDGTYDLHIFCSDPSASITKKYVITRQEEQKTLFCPFIKYEKLSEPIISEIFFGGLQQHRSDEKGIYLESLERFRVKQPTDEMFYISASKSGGSSLRNWYALLRHLFGQEDYKKFKLEFKASVLMQYYKQEFSHEPYEVDRHKQRLFVLGAEKLLQSSAKMPGVLSSETIKEITLQKNKTASLQSFLIPKLKSARLKKQLLLNQSWVPTVYPSLLLQMFSWNKIPPSIVDTYIDKCPSAENLCSALSSLNVKSLGEIENMAKLLPIGTDYWSKIPQKDRALVMSFLWQMASRYRADSSYLEAPILTPTQQNTMWSLLAHCHALSVVINPTLNDYSLPYKGLESNTLTPFFNPKDLEKRQELDQYFKKNEKNPQIFIFSPTTSLSNNSSILKNSPEGKIYNELVKKNTPAYFNLIRYQIKTAAELLTLKAAMALSLVGIPMLFSMKFAQRDTIKQRLLLNHAEKIFSHDNTRYINELRDIAYLAQTPQHFAGTRKNTMVSQISLTGITRRKLKGFRPRFRVTNPTGLTTNFVCKAYKEEEVIFKQGQQQNLINNWSFNPDQEINLQNINPMLSENKVLCQKGFSLPQKELMIDSKEPLLQCQKILADFKKQMNLLTEEKEQTAFFCLLFYRGNQNELPFQRALENPEFQKTLKEFIKDGFTFFKTSTPEGTMNLKGYLFLAQLIRRIQEVDPNFDVQEFDILEKINPLLEKSELSDQDKLQIHLHRALSFSAHKTLSPEEINHFFTSYIYFQNHKKEDPSWSFFHQNQELEKLGKKMFFLYKGQITKSTTLNVINTAMKRPTPIKATKQDMTLKGPVACIEDENKKTFTIDFINGCITEDGVIYNKNRSKTSFQYSELFGSTLISPEQKGRYLVFTEGGKKYRKLLNFFKEPVDIYQMEIGGKWYQYMPEKIPNATSIWGKEIYYHTIPMPLLEGHLVFANRETILFLDKTTKEIKYRYNGVSLTHEEEPFKGQKVYLLKERKIPALQAVEPSCSQVIEKTKDHTIIARLPRWISLTGKQELCFEQKQGEKEFSWTQDPAYKLLPHSNVQRPIEIEGYCR